MAQYHQLSLMDQLEEKLSRLLATLSKKYTRGMGIAMRDLGEVRGLNNSGIFRSISL